MRTRTIAVLAALILVVLVPAIGFWLLDLRGFSARAAPSAPERVLARAVRRWAVPRSERDGRNPVAFTPEVWVEARAHFADHCAICHANDGSGGTEIGRNLYPKAPDMRLRDTQRLTDGELYWIIENGIRLTGMPAWGTGRAGDTDTWKLVHFIRRLDRLTADDLKEMEALNPKSPAELQEEREDREFLEGSDSNDSKPNTETP